MLKHSELTARLAIEGTVAAISGTVRGQLPVKPRVVGESERAELGFSNEGEFLFYPIDDAGVFFYTSGAYTTIWYTNADCAKAISVLETAIQRSYPQAKRVSDGPHPTDSNFLQRTYDINLGAGRLAIVEAIYPAAKGQDQRFAVRITAMGIKS